MEQYFQDAESGSDTPSLQKLKSGVDSGTINGSFDCNICLDFAQDPVVTLCGHLYCWPCIYKWLHFQLNSPSTSEEQQQKCPVCKANISLSTLVPLFGRGEISTTRAETEPKASHTDLSIPRRPPTCGVHSLISTTTQPLHRNSFESQLPSHSYRRQDYYPTVGGTGPVFNLGGTMAPIVGMFGEMVYARVFGNPEVNLFTYPTSNYAVGTSSPRVRRQEMQADKSLNRVSIFLLCCFVLCLLLF